MRWAALVISAIVIGCSAFVLVHEYSGAIFSQLETGDMITRLAEGPEIAPVAMPLTWTGQNEVLEACILLQASLQMALQPSDVKKNVLLGCNDFAQRATSWTPTIALGYLVQAQTAAELKEEAASNLALVRGQAFAPLEGWQALRRANLGLQRLNRLDPAARHALDQDLSFLMATSFGSAAIAQHYVANPDHRALIEAKIADLPNVAQNRFLSDLKLAAKLVQPVAGSP
jgi:hypothetical protein